MPTKPFLSDVNNDALVVLINWLKDSAVQIFQNNNASKKGSECFLIPFSHYHLSVRNSFKVTSALGKGKKTAKKREPLVMIIYGRCGSGKTQLVGISFMARHCLLFRFVVQRSMWVLKLSSRQLVSFETRPASKRQSTTLRRNCPLLSLVVIERRLNMHCHSSFWMT